MEITTTMAASYRPENHVTRTMRGAELRAPGPGFAVLEDCPEVTSELLDFLHRTFPHRVYNPRGENLEEHLVYAGHVGLVEYLEAAHKLQQEERSGPEDDDDALRDRIVAELTVDIPETNTPDI